MKTITKELYVSDDGKEFLTVEACVAHEKYVNYLNNKVFTVYPVNHSFDATEGRGYYGLTYILLDDEFSIMDVIEFCIKTYGEISRSWYGARTYKAWRLCDKIDSTKINMEKNFYLNSNYKKSLVIVCSNKRKSFFEEWANLKCLKIHGWEIKNND